MIVRCKFRCDQITHLLIHGWDQDANQSTVKPGRTIKMSPVYGNNDPKHENTKFWEATPGGSLELNVINASAAEIFEVGKEYYLDLTPAEK